MLSQTTINSLKSLTLSTTVLITAEGNVNVKSKELLSLFKEEFNNSTAVTNGDKIVLTHSLMLQWVTDNVANKAVYTRLKDTLFTIMSYYVSGYDIKIDSIPFTLLTRVLNNQVNISKSSVKKLKDIEDDNKYQEALVNLCTIAEFKKLEANVTNLVIKEEVKGMLDKLTKEELKAVNQYLSYLNKKEA